MNTTRKGKTMKRNATKYTRNMAINTAIGAATQQWSGNPDYPRQLPYDLIRVFLRCLADEGYRITKTPERTNRS